MVRMFALFVGFLLIWGIGWAQPTELSSQFTSAGSIEPKLRWIAPQEDTNLTAGTTVRLVLLASLPNSSELHVGVFVNGKAIGEAQPTVNNRFVIDWAIPGQGNYSLIARAEDNQGRSTTSESLEFAVKSEDRTQAMSLISGRLIEQVIDNFAVGTSSTIPMVEADDGQLYALALSSGAALRLDIAQGTRVNVFGRLEEHFLRVDDTASIHAANRYVTTETAFGAPTALSPVTGTRRLFIARIIPADIESSQAWPLDYITGAMDTTNSFYREVSYRAFNGWEYEVGGPYFVNVPSTVICDTNGNDTVFLNAARRALADSGVNINKYHSVMFLGPQAQSGGACIGGYATGSSPTLIMIRNVSYTQNSAWIRNAMIHELGHSLGLSHAQRMDCSPSRYDPRLACKIYEYGNPIDTMGSAWGGKELPKHFNAVFKTILGWSNPIAAATGEYLIAPLETGAAPNALRIDLPDAAASFMVEYRGPYGVDADFPRQDYFLGALINTNSNPSQLLDMHPEDMSNSISFGPELAVGERFVDAIGRFSIMTLARSSDGLRLRVLIPGVSSPAILVNSPEDGALLPLKPTTVSFDALDRVGIARVDLYLDGLVQIGSSEIPPYSITWDPRDQSPGPHTLMARAYNVYGATATSATKVRLAKPSTVRITSPSEGSHVIAGASIQIIVEAIASESPITAVDFFLDGKLYSHVISGSVLYKTVWVPADPGVHIITARAYGMLGDTTSSTPISINVDPAPPVVSILTPRDAETYELGEVVRIRIQATPFIESKIETVDILVDGKFLSHPVLDSTGIFKVDWEPTELGEFTLSARATDRSGLAGVSLLAKIAIIPPSVAALRILEPYSGASINVNTEVVLSLFARSDVDDVQSVQFYDSTGRPVCDGRQVVANIWDCPWVPKSLGSDNLVALARIAGHDQPLVSKPISIVVTAAPPQVNIGEPLANSTTWIGRAVKITATVLPRGSAIKNVTFQIDSDNTLGVATGKPNEYALTWTPQSTGMYTLKAQAVDFEGRVGHSEAVVVRVVSDPFVEVIFPTNGVFYKLGETVEFQVQAASLNALIKTVEVFSEGRLIGQAQPIESDSTLFTLRWTPDVLGSFSIVAKCTDTLDRVAASNRTTVNIYAASSH